MLRSVLDEIIGFVLPNSCISCGSSIEPKEKFLCPACYSKLEKYTDTHPWKNEMMLSGAIDNSISAFLFREGTPIQQLLHALKYQKVRSAGIMLGGEIGKQISGLSGLTFDYIIPVPLHKARQRDRTFNQSDYIAKGTGGILGARVVNGALYRIRNTGSQTKLNREERKQNVSEAFRVNPEYSHLVKGKNIVLVDDVITTGATILECARALKSSGAAALWVCSAAYAELNLNA